MREIKYRIGGINGEALLSKRYQNFVVAAQEAAEGPITATLYAATTFSHEAIPQMYLFERKHLKGGGRLYMVDDRLILDGSMGIGALPKVVVEEFGKIIVLEIKKAGIEVGDFLTDFYGYAIHPYWLELGFKSE